MNFIESFSNKTILIPLLQRDYVQGSKDSAVISPFLDALLGKGCDLNYIYGYRENGCFVPIDGQQRLTTLWLLYLYLYACKKQTRNYRVHMKFASREYANDFCERMEDKIEEVLSNSSSYESLDKAIKDQNWFIRSWEKNATVSNMLGTLKLIHRKVNEHNIDDLWMRLVDSATPSVTFAFLQMDESNGLDDDIYIKMNGRGRKLSVFENLKSWMDEKVSTRPYVEEWRTEMDNAWTDMFWQNRNQEQEHPEEIDDEQLFFFYNLLILYHIKTRELLRTISKMREEKPYLFEEMQDFFGIDPEADDQAITDKIVDELQKAGNLPLLWIDRLELMPDAFFDFAFNSTRATTEISKAFNSSALYLGEEKVDKTTRTYRVCMCEGSIGRTLPLFYALLSYKQGETTLYDWMRVMRNLILNTSITREDLSSLMTAMDEFGVQCSKENIYSLLQISETKNILKGFNSRQLDEEILKASQLDYYEPMIEMENGRFFSGRIGVLFKVLSLTPVGCLDLLNRENVESYTRVLLTLFDGRDGGCAAGFDDANHLLRRALMTVSPYYFGMEKSRYWCFCDGLDEWREYVNTKDECHNALYGLLKKVLVPAQKQKQCLRQALSDYVEVISSEYEQNLLAADDNSFRYHFIHHPGVWDYMRTKRCMWSDNNYDIELKTSNGNNSDRMELRTYALCLDYLHNNDFKRDCTEWEVGIWPKGKSCMYFERKLSFEQKEMKIAIDVYFLDHQARRTCEDNYAFDLFARSNHPGALSEEEKLAFAEEDYQVNKELFGQLIPEMVDVLERKADGRLRSKLLYSRKDVKSVLGRIMQGINHYIENNGDEG